MPKNFAGKPFRVSLILRCRLIFCFTRLCHDFSWKFLPRGTESLCRGTLLGFILKNICQRKSLSIRSGGSIKISHRKFFCLTVPKNLAWQPFRVSLHSGIEKSFMLKGAMSRVSVEIFLKHNTETFCRGTILCCVSENSGSEKVFG